MEQRFTSHTETTEQQAHRIENAIILAATRDSTDKEAITEILELLEQAKNNPFFSELLNAVDPDPAGGEKNRAIKTVNEAGQERLREALQRFTASQFQ